MVNIYTYIHTSTASSEKSHIRCAMLVNAYVWGLRCMFMQVHEIEKQAILLLCSNSLLCISDAPLSHDSHEVSAAAPAVSFGPAVRPGPSYSTSRVFSSLSEFSFKSKLLILMHMHLNAYV